MNFYASLIDRSGGVVPLPDGVRLVPSRWSKRRLGGMYQAVVAVEGDAAAARVLREMLAYGLRLHNSAGDLCWWGEVDRVTTGEGMQRGATLDRLYNRVRVLYDYSGPDGGVVAGETGWVADTASIDRYGPRELQLTLSETDADAAQRAAERVLDTFAWPLSFTQAATGNGVGTLTAGGYFFTLRRRFYHQPAGRYVIEDGGSAAHPLGLTVTSDDIGFDEDEQFIYHVFGGLRGFVEGERINVSGSQANNGSEIVRRADNRASTAYTATTISFVPNDNIEDSAAGLGGFAEGDLIRIDGSSANDGFHVTDEDGVSHLATARSYGGDIVAESAGASVTIRRGNKIEVSGAIAQELPGNTITLTARGAKIAQRITVPPVGTWQPGEINLMVSKVGAPTDAVRVRLRADGSSPGTTLTSGTVSAASIGSSARGWVTVQLPLGTTLASGASLWVELERTGSGGADCYHVGLDEENASGLDSVLLWDGSQWREREAAATLPMRLWGHEQTTQQAQRMIYALGGEVDGITIADDSGIYGRLWCDGTQDAASELEGMLAAGTASGAALLADVTPQQRLRIYAEPSPSDNDLVLSQDGRVANAYHGKLSAGVLPEGYWLRDSDGLAINSSERVRVDLWQYDVARGLSFRERALPTPEEIAGVGR